MTLLIANVSPSMEDVGQTLSTLRFATRAKTVKTLPAKIEVADCEDEEMVELRATVARLNGRLKEVS